GGSSAPSDDLNNGGEAAITSESPAERPIHQDVERPRARVPEVDLSTVSEADVHKLITDLTRHLDNMGPVNLEAVQEYDELEQRYRFLESQNNDLTSSRKELLEV